MPHVRFVVRVTDLENHTYQHTFQYPAPDYFATRAPTREEGVAFAEHLNVAHRQQVLAARPFQCVGCGKKPVQLMEAPFLHFA